MTLGISVAIVTAVFPDQERGKAVGILGAVISVGHLCGPLLGGLLLDALDWRSIFYTRVPVSIGGLIIAQLLLREQKAPGVRPKFDLWGAATLCGGLTSLLLLVNLGGKSDHVSSTIGILAFCTIVLIALFIVIEKRTDHPIVDLNLFRNTRFASGTGGIMLMFAAVVAMVFLTPFYLINGLGYSASIAGLMMTIHPLTIVIVAPLSGWISDKIGSTLLRTVGTVVFCFALLFLGNLDINSSNLDIALRLIILAVGFGIFDSPNNSSIMGSVSSEHLGTASAMIAASRQVGLAIGTALIGTIFSSRQLFHEFQLAKTIADPVMLEKLSVVAGFHDTILVAVIIAALAIAVSLAGIRIRKRRLP
jgi:EmrB/QacA subfamily drug resistance transporter